MFINRFFKDRSQTIKSLLTFAAIIAVLSLAVWWLNNSFMADLQKDLQQNAQLVLTLILIIPFLWLFVSQIFESLTGIVPNFYKSPDLSYLISTPLKPGAVLIYKLINHIFITSSKQLFIFLPLFLSIAVGFDINPLFYPMAVIVYLLVSMVPSGLGIMFGMLFLRKFSIKSFRYLTNGGNVLVVALTWLIVFRGAESLLPFIEGIESCWQTKTYYF